MNCSATMSAASPASTATSTRSRKSVEYDPGIKSSALSYGSGCPDLPAECCSSSILPLSPNLIAFDTVFRQAYWLLKSFWSQMGNSFYIGIAVSLLTLSIGSLSSFVIGRMPTSKGWMLTHAALLTYTIPMSFLAIPFYSIMGKYGLTNNPIAVIAVEVTFATPYAIFIFQQYGASIPIELDEAARFDGASPGQIFFRVYLPLMAPALVAIGTYALLLAWN